MIRTFDNFVVDHLNCVILGDLNLPKLFQLSCTKDLITTSFETCLSTLGMFHMNKDPTRNENCLDIVLSTSEHLLFDLTSAEPFCNSDHNSVLFKISVSSFKENQIPKQNFRKTDYDALNEFFLTIDWNELFSVCLSPTDMYDRFLNVVNFAIDTFVPLVKFKSSCSKDMRKILSKKKFLWKKYKLSKDLSDLFNFKKCNALFKKEALKIRIKEEQDLFKSKDMSKFFKFVNARLKNAKTAPFLNDNNGTIVYDDVEKANLFNDYFASVFTEDDGVLPNFEARSEMNLKNVVFLKKRFSKL